MQFASAEAAVWPDTSERTAATLWEVAFLGDGAIQAKRRTFWGFSARVVQVNGIQKVGGPSPPASTFGLEGRLPVVACLLRSWQVLVVPPIETAPPQQSHPTGTG